MTKEDDIRSLDLSPRLVNALINSGIRTIGQITQLKKESVSEYRGIGKKVLYELERQLKKYGFSFSKSSEVELPPYTERQREILVRRGLQWMVDERDELVMSYNGHVK